jgi:hypothetical protein
MKTIGTCLKKILFICVDPWLEQVFRHSLRKLSFSGWVWHAATSPNGNLKETSMKQISSQRTKQIWTYLQDQVEIHEQAYFQAGNDYAYKNEMRAAAETYAWLAKEFSILFPTATSSADNGEDGLPAERTSQFLNLLDRKIEHFASAQEQSRCKKQEALAQTPDLEYSHIRRIYREMENLLGCELAAYRDSRERVLSLLEKG